jgi:RNA polymerase sigma-70 factor (ECF subfamily)
LESWLADSQLSPGTIAAHNEQLILLANALAKIPKDQRFVLELRHLRGCSMDTICELTGRTRPAVVGLLYRGLRNLRSLLRGPDEGASR